MLHYERESWKAGFQHVAGLDEVGRGPLAGPVVASSVIIRREFLEEEQDGQLGGLTDSKKLSESRRTHFYELLQSCEFAVIGIGQASVEEIDHFNILKATHLAMRRALDNLREEPTKVLVDGNPVDGLAYPSEAIVGGDGKSLLIAAASVIAKVTRDRLMTVLDEDFPQYGFARNKGYGTPEHLAALKAHGPTPWHRKSFSPVGQPELF